MKMGAAPYFVSLLFLLASVDSARDVSMPVRNAAEGNQPFMTDGLDIHELETIFNKEVSSLENSPTELSHLCWDISRKAQEVLDDQSLIDEINSLASTVCGIPFSDQEAKLRANDTCTACRSFLGNISSQLENTDKKLLIVVYLVKLCDVQVELFGDQCKQIVFTFSPIVLSAIQKILSKDLCYMVRICSDPKNQTENGTMWHTGRPEPYVWSEINLMNLM